MRALRLLSICFAIVTSACTAPTSGPGGGTDPGGTDPGTDPGGTDPGGTTERLTCDTGETYFYLVNLIDVSQVGTDGTVSGINLDGRISDDHDAAGCRQADFTSPPPDDEDGVDNQLAVIARDIRSSLDISASMRDAIAQGKLAVVAELSNVDDFADDDCVHLEVGLGYLAGGAEMPELGADGRPVAGATYDIKPLARVDGVIADGRVYTDPTEIASSLTLVDPPIPVTIEGAEVRFDVSADTLSNGVIGGSMRVSTLLDMVTAMKPDMADLAELVLRTNADLSPGADGCEALSAGFVFEGVSAVRGSTRE